LNPNFGNIKDAVTDAVFGGIQTKKRSSVFATIKFLNISNILFFYLNQNYYICKTNQEHMNMASHNIKIQHEKFGILLNETFVNGTQFKLFLKMVQGCIELKNDLTFFNGTDFFVHVPHKHLVESIITTCVDNYTLAEHLINKTKMEAEVTK
jgi:hypothetical protein